MHCVACFWYYIVQIDCVWVPNQVSVLENFNFYGETNYFKYYVCFYNTVLMLSGNDINPVGDSQIFFVVASMMLGAVVNATIFGNMALLILDMNKKADEFQTIIDTSNTAMKIEKMPPDIQSRVVAYLNYIQLTLE